MRDLLMYLKTTETCQLDCDHCFTNGKNGQKGWFDEVATVDFLKRLKQRFPTFNSANISFHGGEPMIAPLEKMNYVMDEVEGLWDNLTWGIQTNLTYKLTEEKLAFLKRVSGGVVGTSWDHNIRWTTIQQEQLWEYNVRKLVDEGLEVSVIVCVTSDVLKMEPIDIFMKMIGLGVTHVNFERLTASGSAVERPDLFPDNLEMDRWFAKMWEQMLEYKTYNYITNIFTESLLTRDLYNTFAGCRSRECEQKILTLNATGTIGGCPNGAVTTTYGTIHDDINALLTSPQRGCNINTEAIRHTACYTCDVFDMCNGDCHQLNWQGDVCASPKSMMRAIKATDRNEKKAVIGTFKGEEGIRYPNLIAVEG